MEGSSVSWRLLPVPGTLFLRFRCLVQPRYQGFCTALLNLVLSCLAVLFWKPAFFFFEKEKEEHIWVRGVVVGAGKSAGRENYGWNILYERRIFFQ